MNDDQTPLTKEAWLKLREEEQRLADEAKRERTIRYQRWGIIALIVVCFGLWLGFGSADLIGSSDKVGKETVKPAKVSEFLSRSECASNSIGPGNTTAKEMVSAQRGIITIVTGDDGQPYEVLDDGTGRCRLVTERLTKVVPTKAVAQPLDYDDTTDMNMEMDMEVVVPSSTPKRNDDPFYEPPTWEGQKERLKPPSVPVEDDPFE